MVKTEEVKLMMLIIMLDLEAMANIFLILHLKNSPPSKMMNMVIEEKGLCLLILVMAFMMKEAIIIIQINHNIVKEEVLGNGRIRLEFQSRGMYAEEETMKIHQKVKITRRDLLSKVRTKGYNSIIIFMMIYLVNIILR